jgi:hypothetical protein
VPDTNHVIDWNTIQVEPEGEFQVQLVCIWDWKTKQLWNRVINLVKVMLSPISRDNQEIMSRGPQVLDMEYREQD